jgi:hypothetical protein
VKNGKIDLAHARQLGRIKDEEKMLDLLKVAADLTVSQLQDKVEVVVAKEKAKAEAEKAKENAKKPKAKAKSEGGEDGEGGLGAERQEVAGRALRRDGDGAAEEERPPREAHGGRAAPGQGEDGGESARSTSTSSRGWRSRLA